MPYIVDDMFQRPPWFLSFKNTNFLLQTANWIGPILPLQFDPCSVLSAKQICFLLEILDSPRYMYNSGVYQGFGKSLEAGFQTVAFCLLYHVIWALFEKQCKNDSYTVVFPSFSCLLQSPSSAFKWHCLYFIQL